MNTPSLSPARPRWRAQLRLAALIAHLLAGAAVVALWFPLISPPHRNRLKRCWSHRLLDIMGLQLQVSGEIPAHGLLVANHISWLDIYVINAAQPTAFVAKAEIRHWPLIGWLAAQTETLFIERGSHRHARHIAHAMATRLDAGHSVTVFPEGTTSDGHAVLPFHAALLQPAISTGQAVRPLAIRYRAAGGAPTTAPAYIGEMSFIDSVRHTLAERGIVAELIALPALPTGPDSERRALARTAESAIRQAIAGR